MKPTAAMVFLLAAGMAFAAEAPFQQAQKLEREGEEKEAFLAYLVIPGAEYAAVRLSRPKAEAFLEVVRGDLKGPGGVFRPRAKLVEADLLLALGRKGEALACYRAFIAKIGRQPGESWDRGFVPREHYPVEPPSRFQAHQLVQPFTLGPGSHRDNWLIRRLIALDAWEDARGEFARIWEIHRTRARPHVATIPVYQPPAQPGGKPEWKNEKRLFRPAGFDGRGLQFAIDYAYFLKRREKLDEALAVLMEPLLLVDMDRNPNLTGAGQTVAEGEAEGYPERPARTVHGFRLSPLWGASGGVSRKEFIRLAFGEFKTAGRKVELVAALVKQIDQGRNAARRVLARVRLHQGNLPGCLALELAYIERGGLDELSAAYRRGLVYEDCRKLAEAATQYEKALAFPYRPPKLPDKDEETSQRQMMSQRGPVYLDPGSPAGQAAFQSEVLERLARLYGALAQADKVLGVSLRQYEVNAQLLERFESLEATGRRFKAAGKGPEFLDWARERLRKVESPDARANLAWLLGDYATAARALAEQAGKAKGRERNPWAFTQWKERFRNAGGDKLRLLLEALVKANPKDAKSRLELLDLQDRWEPEDVTPVLETLLGQDASYAFARGKGDYNRTRFRNYYDLAYRLMRLYEKKGDYGRLRALGLRVAQSEKPFNIRKLDQFAHRDGNDLPEDVNACLSLAVQHADDAHSQTALEEALQGKPWPWTGALRQLSRRRAGRIEIPAGLKPFGWANAPEGVTLIASNENVLSLARDDKYVYAGHPWGIAVYDFAGEPVTRVALATAARELLTHAGHLWAGTPKGLYRVDTGNWGVAHLACDQDLTPHGPYADNPWLRNGVQALAADGNRIWIGTLRNVQLYDTRKGTLRVYSHEELAIKNNSRWDRFLVEEAYVWADGPAGCRRYDRKTDTWSVVAYDEKAVGLIGEIGGELWGHVWLSNNLRDRPCIIDRGTLAVTPVLIQGNLTESQRCINGPFSYFGSYQGKPVFGPKYPMYVYDEHVRKLRPIGAPWDRQDDPIDSPIPLGLRTGTPRWRGDGAIVCYDDHTDRHTAFGKQFNTGRWTTLPLPDGALVLGGMCPDSPRYEYPNEDWPYTEHARERRDGSGGLYFVFPDGRVRHALAVDRADSIRGDVVFTAVRGREGHRTWLCTNLGVVVLDPAGRVLANFSRRDGLCANRVTSGASLGDRLCFSTGYDHGGGLAVFDPKTSVFTALFGSDGLATDKLAQVRPSGKHIELVYDIEYGRRGPYRYRRFPPGMLDPVSGVVRSGGEARHMGETEGRNELYSLHQAPRRAMPCLGGFVLAERRIGGQTWLCGTRGLVILRGREPPPFVARPLTVKLVSGERERLLKEAERVARLVKNARPDELTGLLADLLRSDNPYCRAEAIAGLLARSRRVDDALLPGIVAALDDPDMRVRATALYAVTKSNVDRIVIPALKTRVGDADRYIRSLASVELARRGVLPPLERIEEVFEKHRSYGNFPFGARSSIGVQVGGHKTCEAIAPLADLNVLALLMKYPPYIRSYDNETKVYPHLGEALRRHPQAAQLLLTANDPRTGGVSNRDFARHIFRFAGKEMLPVLHEALASKDRVVRSNAARACGSIADPSSIPHLIKALDLESGLSRASIVWAFGELKAREALPELVKLYVDARNDEERRRGSGFRAAQSSASIQAHYDSLRNLDAVGADWNELEAAALPKPVDPRANEDLLSPEHVLEAVRKIGPVAAQDFYRALAGEKDSRARMEAAERLAEGGPEDREKNLPILRNLLADNDVSVRMTAAVSLLVFRQKLAERPVIEWLDSPTDWERRAILKQLVRIKDPARLSFARARIEACARDQSLHRETHKAARALLDGVLRE